MEWVRVWVVKTRSDDAIGKREHIAHTVDELRGLLADARADPTVWHVHHESRRELVGDKPTHCGNGHPLATTGTLSAPHDWWPCPCGGHWWLKCRTCGEEIMDPPVVHGCKPHRPRSGH